MTQRSLEKRVVKAANRMVTSQGWLILPNEMMDYRKRRENLESAISEYRAALKGSLRGKHRRKRGKA